MWETICLEYHNHISLHFAICPKPAATSLNSALLPIRRCRSPTGSLRERSTFSFHPLLEDKHQSHLAAHPYSWAAYKYLIAASLQLFGRGERRKEPHMHTPANKHCDCTVLCTHVPKISTVLSSDFFFKKKKDYYFRTHVSCARGWTAARHRRAHLPAGSTCLAGPPSDSIGSLPHYRSPLFSFSVFN